MTREILEELRFMRGKVIEIDEELHNLREDFTDAHLSREEVGLVAEALKDELAGKTVSLKDVKKRLAL